MQVTICDFCGSRDIIHFVIKDVGLDICNGCLTKMTSYCFKKHKQMHSPSIASMEFFSPISGMRLNEIKSFVNF